MTIPTAPPTDDSAPPAAPHRSDRFFTRVAGLGIARSEGWIGGVAAGIAARLRLDPLIVRGVLVVATLCGLPLILLYAIAWALLPDAEGRIHTRALLHGRFEPAQVGILAAVSVGLMTLWPLSALNLIIRIMMGPYSSYDYGFGGATPLSVFGFIVGLALVIVLLVFIVRAARRTPGGSPPAASSAPASDPGAAATVTPVSSTEPAQPADPSDLDAWRAQHVAWQQQERAWREQQQDAERAARDQARREREATAAAFSAEAAERRRIRRASNPRASFAYVATAIGLALVCGAVVWLWSQNPDAVTAALALFAATLVLSFGMIIAGIARRRSGFLAFVTAAALVGATIAGVGATVGDVRFGHVELSNEASADVRQPFGSTHMYLMSFDDARTEPITVHKGEGFTEITVNPGVQLDLTATVDEAVVTWNELKIDDDGFIGDSTGGEWTGQQLGDDRSVIRQSVTSAPDPAAPSAQNTRVPVTIDQHAGSIVITYYARADEGASE